MIAAALVVCFATQTDKALASGCNNNYYVNSSGHVVHTRHPVGKSTRSALRNVATAALTFRSIIAGPRPRAAWRTGIDPTFMDVGRSKRCEA
jgi:hypothetical protein